MTPISLTIIFVFAYIVFGVTGFGSALVAMPLLSSLIGVETAAPLFALIALVSEGIMLLRHREHFDFRLVWRLIVTSTIAIPVGIVGAHVINQHVAVLLLGILVAGYGVYGLWSPRLPQVKDGRWAFGFGFVGGLLNGAYNMGGPPIVIYASLSRWPATDFKGSMQSLFIINSLVIIVLHAISGHYNANVLDDTLLGLPAMIIGLLLGWRLERYINPQQFRKLVLIMLVIIGLNLIVTNLPLR
jgi:uncharacterized membrane protein YfcA